MESNVEIPGSGQNCFGQTTASSRNDHDINWCDPTDGRESRARHIDSPVLRWHERRVAIRTLETLNDRHRLGIGNQRSDIPSLIAKGRQSVRASQ